MLKSPTLLFASVFIWILAEVQVDCETSANPPVPEALKLGTKAGNPGMHLRLTRRAVNYIVDVAGKILSDEIPNLRIERLENSLGQHRGKVTLSRVRVIHFKPPESYGAELFSPDRLKVVIRGADLTTTAAFTGNIRVGNESFLAVGTVNTTTTEVDQNFTTRLDRGADGRPHLKTIECRAHIGQLSMDFDVTGNGAELLQNFKEAVEERAKGILEAKICQLLTGQIETDLNKQFRRLGDVIPLRNLDSRTSDAADEDDSDVTVRPTPKSGQSAPSGDQLQSLQNSKRRDGVDPAGPRISRFFDAQNLSLDARLTRKPTVTPEWIETFHRGEVSWRGEGRTPFSPAPLPPLVTTEMEDVRMVYVQISDFLINSLLFNAFKNGNATLVADDATTPDLRERLRTACLNVFDPDCFGNIFPSTRLFFPTHKVEISAPANAPPYMLMAKAAAKLHISTNVTVTAVSSTSPFARSPLFTTDAVLEADGQFQVVGSRLTAFIDIRNVVIRRPTTGPLAAESQLAFERFGTFLSSVMSSRINQDLQRGVQLPILKYAALYDPLVTTFDRGLLVQTDFHLDELKLRRKAHLAISKALNNLSTQTVTV